jgi:hypothetical protein
LLEEAYLSFETHTVAPRRVLSLPGSNFVPVRAHWFIGSREVTDYYFSVQTSLIKGLDFRLFSKILNFAEMENILFRKIITHMGNGKSRLKPIKILLKLKNITKAVQ